MNSLKRSFNKLKAPKWLVLSKKNPLSALNKPSSNRFTSFSSSSQLQPAEKSQDQLSNTSNNSSNMSRLVQVSNTKQKYDRIKLRSRQQQKQPKSSSSQYQTRPASSSSRLYSSNSSQGLKSTSGFDEYEDEYDEDDDMYSRNNAAIKNAKSLGYLQTEANNMGSSMIGDRAIGADGDQMRRSLSNYTYVGAMSMGSSMMSSFCRDSSSRHSLKPLSVSNGSLNSNWYKPKSLQLPPPSSSTNYLETALNGDGSQMNTGLLTIRII